jgi:hypothetical protein
MGGLAVALTQIARLESNRESRKTVRRSTATGPTSKSAATRIRYSSATSPGTRSDGKRNRIAAENFYQHAEHYFRINHARREDYEQGTAPRPITPVDVEINSEADSRKVDVGRFQPQWDGEDSVSSETSTEPKPLLEPTRRYAAHLSKFVIHSLSEMSTTKAPPKSVNPFTIP